MALTLYSNIVSNVAQNCNDYWRGLQQAEISSLFNNTTIQEEVYEEEVPFNFVFDKTTCWVSSIVDSTLNAEKNEDDYIGFYFEDCTHVAERGRYYKWDNNYWICYQGASRLESYSTIKARRCNNVLKWLDDDNVIHEYPCVIDYNFMSPTPQVSKTITTPNGHIAVIVQGNEDTLALKKNKRFLFNGVAYKFEAINNYMQQDCVTKDTPILFMDMFYDVTQPDDNIEEGLANDNRVVVVEPIAPSEKAIVLESHVSDIKLHRKATIKATVYQGENATSDVVTCVASNAQSDSYNITILGNNTWEVENLKFYPNNILILTFTSGDKEVVSEIVLRNLY